MLITKWSLFINNIQLGARDKVQKTALQKVQLFVLYLIQSVFFSKNDPY